MKKKNILKKLFAKTIDVSTEEDIKKNIARFEDQPLEQRVIIDKINEMIDVLNALYTLNTHNDWDDELEEKEPFKQDCYNDDWIGTLCRFWDENTGDSKHKHCHYGILESINHDKDCELRFTPADVRNSYRYCEPIDAEEIELYNGNYYPRAWLGCVPTIDCCTYNPDNDASTSGGLF